MYVNGVLGVSNNLGVVPTGSYLHENIAGDIISALDRNGQVNADDIDVKVEDGMVALGDTVENLYCEECRLQFRTLIGRSDYRH